MPNSDFIAVAAGGYHSLGLKQDGSIFTWGWKQFGQCNIPSPNIGFITIAAGQFHSLGLKQDGSIVAWGAGGPGQSGQPHYGQAVPPAGNGFIAITAGWFHSLGLKQDGSIVAWGWNDDGQCNIPSPNTGFISIAAGYRHSLGLNQDGSIVAWGANANGQCNIPSPNSDFIAIASGALHSLGLKQDGSIFAWGYNYDGECNVPSPNTHFSAIAAGGDHSLGLKQDGSVVAWGDNKYSQCNIPSPNTGFVAIAAGHWHSLAIREQIIYVDSDAAGNNDGSSWKDAYNYLQDALADANSSEKPVEIRVAQGIYKPDEDTLHPNGTDDRTAAFQLINGVTVKGGYAGPRMYLSGVDPNVRDIKKYKTILSGDLNGNDIDVNDPCDLLTEPTRDENSYHIFYHPEGLNLDNTAILDGFTITAGNANSSKWPHSGGGGIFNYNSSPKVEACTFTENSARWGGGMRNEESSRPTVINCTFSGNSADYYGGGMGNYYNYSINYYSNPIVKGCTFSGNSAGFGGGGMDNNRSSPTVTNCTFSDNKTWGAMMGLGGGGMRNYEQSRPNVKGCTFSGNSAGWGGGMCNYYNSPNVKDCTFSGNSATEYGGGIYNNSCSPTVNNCTIADNNAADGQAMACDSYEQMYPSTVRMVNCIIWNGSNWLWNNDNSTITATYSDVQGGWPGEGNIDADPCFVQPKGWIPIQGLISYWRFDEGSGTTALDSVGNNNGTIYGAQWTTGRVGGALDFDGNNDYVSILENPALDNLNAITLEAWIYPRRDSHWHILDKGDGDKRLYAEGTSLSMDGRVRYSGSHAFVRSASNTVILNAWQHVVLTWSRLDNTTRLYRNGVEVSYSIKTMGSGSVVDDTSHPWTIGARGALGEVTFFDGLIDEAALYDRVLSAEEIQKQYQKGLLGQGYLDEATPDYHLLPSSPCINAGDPCYVPGPNETDIDGEARVMWGTVDMGADEFNPIRLGIISKKRVARTEFVYDCNATFTNLWPFAVKNVELEMVKASDNIDINEPNVLFGDVEFSPRQSITSIDICTFTVDRSRLIDAAKIDWKVKCQRIDTGQLLELTINGVVSGALDDAGEGKVDLAELVDKWLWIGDAGDIKEDITGDGIVNLRDLAVLTER